MPAEQYFSQFSDQKALKTEKGKVIALLQEIETKMKEISKQGVRINFSNSIKEINAAIRDLDKTVNTLSVVRKEYAVSSSKIIQLKQKEAQVTKDLTNEEALLKVQRTERNKQLRLEAQLRNSVTGSYEEASLKLKLYQHNLGKVNVTTEEGLILQDSLNKKIAETNKLIQTKWPEKAAQTGSVPPPSQPQDVPFTHNLDDLEREREALKGTGDVVNELNEAQADAAMTANEWAAAQRNAADAAEEIDADDAAAGVVEYKDELERLTGSLSENQELLSLHKKELSDVQSEMKLLEKTTSTSEKSTAQYQNKMEALRSTETKLKAEIKDLNGTIKQQTIEANAAKGSLDQLRARYALLTREIDRLGESGRKTDLGRRLIAEAAQVQTSIKTVEGETLRFQRNVGNYGSAVGNAFKKTYSFLKQAAAAIPGFGLAGLIGLAIGPLIDWIQKLTNTVTGFKRAQQDIKAAMSVATGEANGQVATFKLLYEISQDTTQSLEDRKDATKGVLEITKQHNEATGEQIKFETDANGILVKNTGQYDLLSASMLKYAKTKGYLSLITKAYEQLAEAEVKSLEDQTTNVGNAIRAIGGYFTGDFGGFNATINKAVLNKEKGIKNAQEYVDSIEKVFKEKVKSGELDLSGVFDDKKKDKSGKAIEDYGKNLAKILADINKENFDALKKRREDEIKTYEDITNAAEKGYYERYAASQRYYDKSRELIELNSTYELAQAQNAIKEEKRQIELKLNKKDLTAKQRADLNATLLALDEKLKADEEAIRARKNSASLALDKTSETQRTSIFKAETDKRKKLIEDEEKFKQEHQKNVGELNLEKIESEYDRASFLLDERFVKGLDSEKDYNRKKQRLEAERQIATIETEINTTVALIEEQEKRFKIDEDELAHDIKIAKAQAALETDPDKKKDKLAAIEAAEKSLTQLRVADNDIIAQSSAKLNSLLNRLDQIRLDIFKKKNKETKDDFLKTFKDISDAARQAFEFIGGFVSASAERDKNRIQSQIDLLEEQRLKDIEVANQTITNAQDREAALIQIDSTANARRKQYEIEQRQAEERNARFQKAATISQIVLATALAVITALKEGDPLTKIPRAIAAGAIGAAQLAIAVATPIPRYAEGTDDAEAGLSLVGEEGRELAVDPNGRLTLYEKPTITNLIGGTKVLPNRVTEDIMRSNKGVHIMQAARTKEPLDRTDEVLVELRAIKKNRPKVMIVNKTPIETTAYWLKNIKG